MTATWLESFKQFFSSHARLIDEIFDASGCREGWLQGEMYRYFKTRRPIDVNTFAYPLGGKADISASAPTAMVAEVKLLGGDYQRKVLTGGALGPLLAMRGTIRRHHRAKLALGSFGLIPDYKRLTSVRSKERILILVVDKHSHGDLSELLRKIHFHGECQEVDRGGRMLARLWQLR